MEVSQKLVKQVAIRGGILIVDADVATPIGRWSVHRDGYVRDSKGRALHRLIMSPGPEHVVDHINGNPLDNRFENLRVCTQQQNLWNGSAHRDSTSRYRGVSWNKAIGRWRVQIQGKCIGHFADERVAADAYNAAAAERFGAFAKLNVVREAGIEPARA